MPENLYFRQPDTQRMLLDILFIYCKLNPDIGYRQGMHELLAPLIWVVERDAIELGPSSKAMGEDAIVKAVFDADYIEHDAFALFAQVMQGAKGFYEQTTHAATDNPIVTRSKHICSELLLRVDRELASHLQDIDIVPQVFLMRWIRLLFGREFAFDDMLTIWDVIFAEDTSLDLVNEICLVMLLRIRWDLVDADYNAALTLLLRYPAIDQEHTAQAFALDALYLRDHMHSEGGSYVVLKYTGRPLQPTNRPATPPALQRNITTFSGDNAIRAAASSASPARSSRHPRNIESIFQSTARNIYVRGESFGIGKVVRSAVDEVHKKAQEIRESQTRPVSGSWTPRRLPPSGPGAVYARVEALETRNKQLAKLLEGAVSELWDCQKYVNDGGRGVKEADEISSGDAEKLSLAIAKVQFVQVYLADSSLALPESAGPDEQDQNEMGGEEVGEMPGEQRMQETPAPTSVPEQHPPPPEARQDAAPQQDTPLVIRQREDYTDPSHNSEPVAQPPPPTEAAQSLTSVPPPARTSTPAADPPTESTSTPTRPALEQSSFSWMLGSDEKTPQQPRPLGVGGGGSSRRTSPAGPGRNRGFLFGDNDHDHDNDTEPADLAGRERVVYHPRRKAGRERKQKKIAASVVVGGSGSVGGEDAFGGEKNG